MNRMSRSRIGQKEIDRDGKYSGQKMPTQSQARSGNMPHGVLNHLRYLVAGIHITMEYDIDSDARQDFDLVGPDFVLEQRLDKSQKRTIA